ncbi:MAG: hypothetical protein J6Y02_02835 [Pseudobutyrivibrio sp.]|nr:hypothetical protein [Pseudobutyrivibrio sp.]
MAKKYLNEVKEVLDGAEEVSNKIDPKAEAALKEQVKKESKASKKTGGLRV